MTFDLHLPPLTSLISSSRLKKCRINNNSASLFAFSTSCPSWRTITAINWFAHPLKDTCQNINAIVATPLLFSVISQVSFSSFKSLAVGRYHISAGQEIHSDGRVIKRSWLQLLRAEWGQNTWLQ